MAAKMIDAESLAPLAWRLAALRPRLEDFLDALAPALPAAARLSLRRLDHPARALETQGEIGAGADAGEARHVALSAPVWAALLNRLERGEPMQEEAPRWREAYPGLLAADWSGPVALAALRGEEGPSGLLLLAAPAPLETAAALAEPCAAALANEQRWRELASGREAAEAERRALLQRLKRQDISDSIVGADAGLAEVMRALDQVAPADTPVLILGETGTGKEVAARALHARSRRSRGPFLRVNCGAIPPELIDSELFGHERGSFTGATGDRRGWFERADGGVLFLDEVGELPQAAQVRLLRVLQDGTFQRVGGERTLNVDVRVVAATNRDLRAAVAAGAFREDLWFRLAVFPILLPPLRERIRDIPALAAHFALRAAERLGLPPRMPDAADLALLEAYPWPGNVRELASVLERAAILGDGRKLEVARALGFGPTMRTLANAAPAAPEPRADRLDDAMKRHIEAALERCHGRIEGPFGAARALDLNPHTLRSRMRKLGVDWARFRG